MKAYERLLKYVKVYTTSSEDSGKTPSADREFELAKILVDELKALGVKDAEVDDKCYVYGHIPATPGYEDKAKLGFIAHLDTAPDFCGENVKPQVIDNYNGEEIVLGNSGRSINSDMCPELRKFVGRTVITTDGTTLLGADDKAGIAEIMTAVEEIISEGSPHGMICIAFTPDEEIGCGADYFDIKKFGADFGYTIDGGAENEVEYENFNAASAEIHIKGVNVHPGSSKDKMVNAGLVAMEYNALLPAGEIPRETEGYEGFFHLTDMKGNVESACIKYIVRDHDADRFDERKLKLIEAGIVLNDKYGEGTVEIEIKDQYRNMSEKIKPHMHLIDNAFKAIEMAGEVPVTVPIRGGTDGARLSYMGLPCPNLGTGGYDFHGPLEHISAEGMDTVVNVIKNLVMLYSE